MFQSMRTLTIPEKKIKKEPTTMSSIRAVVTNSWLNVLWAFIPISWVLHFTIHNDTVIFVCAFLAIIPLASNLGFATEEVGLRLGQTLAALLNCTLGNAVEVIVSIIALVKCELRIVQSSLVGSVLSNLLLVLGMCFFAGGMRYSEQQFLSTASQINSSLLTISVIAVLIPAAFQAAIKSTGASDPDLNNDVLRMSHGAAVILLAIYIGYLVFQLWSHSNLYDSKTVSGSTRYAKKTDEENPSPATTESTTQDKVAEEEEEEETVSLSWPVALGTLVVVTVLVAITAEFLVDSINGLTASGAISKEWVGLILLPIVGNAAEHVTAVTVSVKDKLDLSIGVAVGSSIQISLFVIPLVVIISWIMGKNLTLLFDPFESIILFLAVLVVNYCTQDGKSNWLEGMILMCLYILIAVATWFYPDGNTDIPCRI